MSSPLADVSTWVPSPVGQHTTSVLATVELFVRQSWQTGVRFTRFTYVVSYRTLHLLCVIVVTKIIKIIY